MVELDAKFEAMLWSICQNGDGRASARIFLDGINRTGVRAKTDHRLTEVMRRLRACKVKPGQTLESVTMDRAQFKNVLAANLPLISKIFRNDLVIPEFQSFCDNVTSLYNKHKENFGGAPASYIPQLARAPKEKWGISICTVDGQRFSIGDVNDKFTIQSTSKPITYALTLEELGTDTVHKYQGREPSGRMFNEIVLDHNNQPHNPMVNSGAIMSASILLYLLKPEMNMAQKYDYVFDFFKRMAGGEYLGFNNSIFLSERDSADRNCALAYFLRENLCFPPGEINIQNTLDFYFQTCSLEMTSESESVVAATLANGGVCPTTDERVVRPECVKNVLSLMLSCGLYNYSGDFAFKVGLPAKSGVSGALVLVIPNVMGITFWSPPLDAMGNTVRGVQFCEEFVHMYNFHKMTGELADASGRIVDPTRNKYEVASQLIIHLLMAASAGDETALKGAFHQGVDMNLGDYDGRTALHLAAAEGHVRCVKFLLEECKVKHDCKDRWGQTPLTEAILFKHTKVASMIKRHERTLNLHQSKGEVKSLVNGGSSDKGADVIWRKLVERSFMKPEKEKPKFKFDRALVDKEVGGGGAANGTNGSNGTDHEKALADLKTSLQGRLGSKRTLSTGGPGEPALGSLPEHHSEGERKEQEAKEEESAARFIQNKFKELKLRRQSRDNDSGISDSPSPNGEPVGASTPMAPPAVPANGN